METDFSEQERGNLYMEKRPQEKEAEGQRVMRGKGGDRVREGKGTGKEKASLSQPVQL